MFMLMKAVSCRKPGYTRRMKPACGQGTRLMRLRSNQPMGRSVASRLTWVGLMRQSTGPAISVRLRGAAGSSSSAISAVAASAATQGWHTATMCTPGPMARRNSITCRVYSSSPKRPLPSGTSRALCQSVM